jgi:hypothetical protein
MMGFLVCDSSVRIPLETIRQWLFTQHKFKLFDISLWISNGDWQDWKLGNIPPWRIFFFLLKGLLWFTSGERLVIFKEGGFVVANYI